MNLESYGEDCSYKGKVNTLYTFNSKVIFPMVESYHKGQY